MKEKIKKEIIKRIKETDWEFKDISEIFTAAETRFWEIYNKLIENNYQQRSYNQHTLNVDYSHGYDYNYYGGLNNNNNIDKTSQKLVKEAKEKAAEDEKEFEKIKKKLLKK